jgi:uncharacterized protein (UPF0332 family)
VRELASFERRGLLSRKSPDAVLAAALVQDAWARLEFAERTPLVPENAKYIVEGAYEAVREAADALLALEGYRSASHEASIAFLQRYGAFEHGELTELDRWRMVRNVLKYHGRGATEGDAREALSFARRMVERLAAIHRSLAGRG